MRNQVCRVWPKLCVKEEKELIAVILKDKTDWELSKRNVHIFVAHHFISQGWFHFQSHNTQ